MEWYTIAKIFYNNKLGINKFIIHAGLFHTTNLNKIFYDSLNGIKNALRESSQPDDISNDQYVQIAQDIYKSNENFLVENVNSVPIDIANYEKVLTDSMVRAGIMVDDHFIHRLTQVKMGIRDDGLVRVIIKPFLP
jgi:hypothetical protein